MSFPILWLTGNSGAGKTTLAEGFERYWNNLVKIDHPWARRVIVLDGNEMRATISLEDSLSADDRRKHNLRVARLASLLQSKGFVVVVAVIAPYKSVRNEISSLCSPLWIYIKRDGLSAPDRPYEVPKKPAYIIDNTILSKKQGLQEFLTFARACDLKSRKGKREKSQPKKH